MKKIFTLCLLLIAGMTATYAQQSISFSLITPPCHNNGVLQATATGLSGTITYQFSWHLYSTNLSQTNTTGILSNYAGGPVMVSATGSISGSASRYYTGAPPFNYNISTTIATCPALSTVTATATGGAAPYVYEWTPVGSTSIVATGGSVSLPSGPYNIKITDAAGCTVEGDSVHLSTSSGLTITSASTPSACTNGSITVTSVTGGVGPYSYLWSNGASTSSISGLVSGFYFVAVTSAQGCTEHQYFYLSQTPVISVNVTPTPATCTQTNGSAIAFGAGGVPPYSFLWSNTQTGSTATSLTGGNYYSVTATDVNGCSGVGQAYISSSTPITATYTASASSCTAPTGSATVSASGGTAPYIISWNTFPSQTGATASSLAPGSYSFTVTDATGCIRTGTAVVPPVSIISANINAVDATCTQTNGSLSTNVFTGTAPYSYLWNNGGTTASLNNVAAGSYSVQITDQTGCKITKYANVLASSPVNAGLNVTQASCIYAADGSIVATASGGTAPYTYTWNNGATSSTINTIRSGNYSVTIQDAAGCKKSGFAFVPFNPTGNACYCTITGVVYNDVNNNCIKDATEVGIPNVMIHASGLGYAFTDAAGNYSFKAPSGTYILSEQIQAMYPLSACQNNAQSVSVTAASGCISTVNFGNSINPIHDISVQTLNFNGPPVPGNPYYQTVVVSNNGTVPEAGVLTGYSPDAQLSSPVFIPGYFSMNSAGNYRNNSSFGNMVVGSNKQVNIAYNVPTNIPLATSLEYRDSVSYSTPMSNWLNDYSPWNNVNAYNATVVGSFDPNNKEVSPKGTGAQGYIARTDSVLTYTIHFQNTGTYPAQKVVLVDTLSSNLMLSSIRVGASNHTYKAAVTEGGVLTFTFDNINLPDSTSNPLGSIGYVIYTVHPKPNLIAGTQIKNKAAIYFDYNAPVITNTTLNTIKEVVGIGQVNGTGSLAMTVYPNPAKDQVSITIQSRRDQGNATIRFVNLVGQVVLQQEVGIHAGKNTFNVAAGQFTPGMYFVVVADGNDKAVAKLNIVR